MRTASEWWPGEPHCPATFGLSREGKEPRDRRQQVSANINSDNNCK